MKKLIVFFIGIMFWSFSPINLSAGNDLSKDELSGPVKMMTKSSYFGVEKNGKYEKSEIRFYPFVTYYNKVGNRTLGKEYDPAGSVVRTWVYKYDNNGNRIQEQILDINGTTTQKVEYKYDDKNNLIKRVVYDGDGKIRSSCFYKFDEKGNKIEEKYIDPQGKIVKTFVFKYDDKGNLIEDLSYKGDSSLFAITKYKYDDKNNLLEFITYKNGVQTWKETYKYDNKGQMTEKTAYTTENNKIWKINNEYNANGDIINRTQQIFKSDIQNQNPSVYIHVTGPNNITKSYDKPNRAGIASVKFIYEYDAHGNWIKKISVGEKGEITIDEREIEYYEN